ncbi:MAG: hypothetical protein LKJ17_07010 [Oscillospiraceae bacterium]|nr:hypothetical protein [Oscillospiraceae bacterium]
MKKLYYIILILGFLALILAACASDSGADLPSTVPAGLCASGLIWFGVSGLDKLDEPARRIRSNREEMRKELGKGGDFGC